MLKLDGRLQAVLDQIPDTETLADIGCDHGKLIVSAILSNKAEFGIAVDISIDSLNKAKDLAIKYGILDKIQFFCGDGFLPIKKEVDCAIIAGMGGYEITKILTQKDIAKKYILVPHQDVNILRKYLQSNQFFIEKDFVVKVHKFYQIIVAVKGESNYILSEIYLGKNLPQSKYYEERLNNRYEIVKKIVENNTKADCCDNLSEVIKEEWEELKKWRN